MRKKSTVEKQALLLQQEMKAKTISQQLHSGISNISSVIPPVANPLASCESTDAATSATFTSETIGENLTAALKAFSAAGKGVRHQFNGYLKSPVKPPSKPIIGMIGVPSQSQQNHSLAKAELQKNFENFHKNYPDQNSNGNENLERSSKPIIFPVREPTGVLFNFTSAEAQMIAPTSLDTSAFLAPSSAPEIVGDSCKIYTEGATNSRQPVFYQNSLLSESNLSLADLAMIPAPPPGHLAANRRNTSTNTDEITAKSSSSTDSAGLNFIDFPPGWDNFQNDGNGSSA